jgi:hypothetical protein
MIILVLKAKYRCLFNPCHKLFRGNTF